MTWELWAGAFSEPDRYLRVWFSSDNVTFDHLTPDTRIAAVPYALQAERVKGYAGVVVVAKSGGDYDSIQAAIDSITDASDVNPYLVWVAPGVYWEQVTMKPYVHLQGAGTEVTAIAFDATHSAWPPGAATLALANDTSLRDLAVGNYGTGVNNVAVLASPGYAGVLVADVKAVARGTGTNNQAIFLTGSGTEVTLQHVTAVAENGSNANLGLVNSDGAAATLHGCSFTALGGDYTWGILNGDSPTTLEAADVTALGEDGNDQNHGLVNNNGAYAVLHGGSFTGRGGTGTNWGIANQDPGTYMEAADTSAVGENGSGGFNHGLDNSNAATVILRGGFFTGIGGVNAYGIHNDGATTLVAEGITALGEGGSDVNYGLDSSNDAETTLYGGEFTARDGTRTYGISNSGTNANLKAESVTALGDAASTQNTGLRNTGSTAGTSLHGGSFFGHQGDMALGIFNYAGTLQAVGVTATGGNGTDNFGLDNEGGGDVAVQGGSFTAFGGTRTFGIRNADSGTSMGATGATALAVDASSGNYGLENRDGATMELRGGDFTGNGGLYAWGLLNTSSNAWLEAVGVASLGVNGSVTNLGLYNGNTAEARIDSSNLNGGGGNGLFMDTVSGPVYLGVSQLVTSVNKMGGTLTCYGVYDSNYIAYTCPP
jgi:hypothetical protein